MCSITIKHYIGRYELCKFNMNIISQLTSNGNKHMLTFIYELCKFAAISN